MKKMYSVINNNLSDVLFTDSQSEQKHTSVCEGLTKDNILELTRLYVDDGYGSNIESNALSKTFKWIKENDKNIKVLLSYAIMDKNT